MNDDAFFERLLKEIRKIPPKDKTYENVIAVIRYHMAYYLPHAQCDAMPEYQSALANGHVEGLKELLDFFDEHYEGHKSYCGKGISCTCGYSQLHVAKVETVAHYECKCGHTWTDDEYPIAYYSTCPQCGVKNVD